MWTTVCDLLTKLLLIEGCVRLKGNLEVLGECVRCPIGTISLNNNTCITINSITTITKSTKAKGTL